MVGLFRKIEKNAGEDSIRWSDLESKCRKEWLVKNIPNVKSELELARKKVEKLEQKLFDMEQEVQNL